MSIFNNILAHPKTSVMGLLICIVTIAGVLSQHGVTLGNAGDGTVVALVGAIATALLGLLAQDPDKKKKDDPGNGTKVGMILIAFLLAGAMASAQTSLNASATASAIHYDGAWSLGTELTQQVPVYYWGSQKGNVASFGVREILAPTPGWSAYGALLNIQPDISGIIAKTPFNPDQFQFSVDLMGGAAKMAEGTTLPAVQGRGNLSYALTPGVALTAVYGSAGVLGRQTFTTLEAGIAANVFGVTNIPAASMKRLIKKAAAKRATAMRRREAKAYYSSAGDCARAAGSLGVSCQTLAMTTQ